MNDKDTPLPGEMPMIQNLPSGNQGQRPVKCFIIIKAKFFIIIVSPYPWFHFPQLQLPVVNGGLKILNEKFQK